MFPMCKEVRKEGENQGKEIGGVLTRNNPYIFNCITGVMKRNNNKVQIKRE